MTDNTSESSDTGAEMSTLKGNKTSEVCGRIDPESLSLGPTLGMGEFGSVLKGVWVSPAGDQVSFSSTFQSFISQKL